MDLNLNFIFVEQIKKNLALGGYIHINIYVIKFSKNKEQEAEQERGQAFYIIGVSNLTRHGECFRQMILSVTTLSTLKEPPQCLINIVKLQKSKISPRIGKYRGSQVGKTKETAPVFNSHGDNSLDLYNF